MRAEVGLGEGDGEGGVGGEVEFWVPFSPVFDYGDVDGRSGAGTVDFCHFHRREKGESGGGKVVGLAGGVKWGCEKTWLCRDYEMPAAI